MCHSSNEELSPLVSKDIHHQKDQDGNNVLASVKLAIYHVDATPDEPESHEADLYNIILGRIICGIKNTKQRSSSKGH